MSGHLLSKLGNNDVVWHVTYKRGMWYVTYDTHGMLNMASKFRVPSSNGFKDCFVWRFSLHGYLYNHMLYPISFNSFFFFDILNPYTKWITFYLVFSIVQHLLWWVYFHLLSEKYPPIILDKMLLFKIHFSKRAFWIRAFFQVVLEGIWWEKMWNALLLYQKCPSIFLEIFFIFFLFIYFFYLFIYFYFYSKCPFNKGHFE